MSFKIIFDRNKCIGAFSCVAVNGDMWKPANDGKVDLLGATKNGEVFELIIDETELAKNQPAVLVCPASAIQIVEAKE